jgi:hypothetical protein
LFKVEKEVVLEEMGVVDLEVMEVVVVVAIHGQLHHLILIEMQMGILLLDITLIIITILVEWMVSQALMEEMAMPTYKMAKMELLGLMSM